MIYTLLLQFLIFYSSDTSDAQGSTRYSSYNKIIIPQQKSQNFFTCLVGLFTSSQNILIPAFGNLGSYGGGFWFQSEVRFRIIFKGFGVDVPKYRVDLLTTGQFCHNNGEEQQLKTWKSNSVI
ncbi:Hypothetical_protein [Hexamita inflata]|uniref:Hypothetical_protein n=1 Tax=Hexamita inflata TaxID=28002 RepID=A0ABP1HWJ8_9EUKA